MRILRQDLAITDTQTFQAIGLNRILSVADSRSAPGFMLDLWYESSYKDDAQVTVIIIGTGNPIDIAIDNYRFLGTVVAANELVWHVYVDVPVVYEGL